MGCTQGNARGSRKEEESMPSPERTESSRLQQLLLVLRHTYLPDDAANESIIQCRTFTYRDIESAFFYFGPKNVLGERDLGGKVFRGYLNKQNVAIKFSNILDGERSTRQFANEVSTLCRSQHRNIIRMVGFCCQGDQRILVCEHLPLGSLEQRLFDIPPYREPLDWRARKIILSGIASGLEYLHEEMDPPVQLGGLTSSSILLDEEFTPKLSYFGLVNLASPSGMQADIYSFGMVSLEIITGRRANDLTRNHQPEQDLANWTRTLMRENMVDPSLGEYSQDQLRLILDFVSTCLLNQPERRPTAKIVSRAINVMTHNDPLWIDDS